MKPSLCAHDVAHLVGLGSAQRLNRLCLTAGVLRQEPKYGLWWPVDPEDPRFHIQTAVVPGKGPCKQTRWTREGVEWAREALAKITPGETQENYRRHRATLWQADLSRRAMEVERVMCSTVYE